MSQPTKGLSQDKLYKLARRKGELDTGYHIILHANGDMEHDRDIDAVAMCDFPDYETSIYVLADAKDTKHLSDAQHAAIEFLEVTYSLPIKYVEV